MKKFLLLSFVLLLSACDSKVTTLDGTYENQKGALGNLALTFKPNGTVTVKEFGKPSKDEEHQYKVVDDRVQIQNFVVPLTIYKDGSLDGYILGVFKKK